MTASWTVPASGAQFPFGPRSAPSASPSPRAAALAPCTTRSRVYVRARERAGVMRVRVSIHREATKRATFRRPCFLRVSAPVGQTNRPAPTGRSDDH